MANQPVTVYFPGVLPVGGHLSIAVNTVQPVILPTNANAWLVQAVTQNVRITLDAGAGGAMPTPTHGFQLRAGDAPVLIVAPNINFFFYAIAEVAGAFLEVQPVSQAF